MNECSICGIKGIRTTKYCENCQKILWQITEILLGPYLNGTIEPEVRRFLPELDFLFRRDVHVQRYFNVAWDLWYEFVLLGRDEISFKEVSEMEYVASKEKRNVLEVLEKAGIVKSGNSSSLLPQMKLRPGILFQRAQHINLSNFEFNDPSWRMICRETVAILTLALTLTLIKNENHIPKDIIRIFILLTQHILNHLPSQKITKRIAADRQMQVFSPLTPTQRKKILIDMVGLSPMGARIIDDINKQGDLFLKKESLDYCEFIRQRLRVRERER